MIRIQKMLAAICIVLAAMMSGCSGNGGDVEHGHRDRNGEHGTKEGRGEHDRDGDGHDGKEGRHGKEGEESGKKLALTETYDNVRDGARLILAYDAKSNSFVGTVQNTTKKILKRVRVEVHLSNGKELGPTKPVDLGPDKKIAVNLTAKSEGFDRWSAHPEVGNNEHGKVGAGNR